MNILILFVILVSSLSWCNSIETNKPDCDNTDDGTPLSIVKFDKIVDKNCTAVIDYDALNQVLMHPEVKDRKIVVVSIVGALKKGKTFFLDYCLRFMYANVRNKR